MITNLLSSACLMSSRARSLSRRSRVTIPAGYSRIAPSRAATGVMFARASYRTGLTFWISRGGVAASSIEMKSRSRRSADETTTSNVVVSPAAAGDERTTSPFSRPSSWEIVSEIALGTPRSPIDLKTTDGVSTWISTCSPVGADCTMSLQFLGFPSACTAKVPARRPRRSFGSSPQSVLIDTIAASAACRSIGGSSAHTSARRRDPLAACIRRGIHTPSTSCRTLTSVGLHSMSTVEARELTAI